MKYILILSLVFACFTMTAHAGVPVTKQFSISSDGGQQVAVSVTTASARFLRANFSRAYLMIQNRGTDTVFIKVGSTISGSEGISLAAGASYEFNVAPVHEVWMKANSGTQSVSILEGIGQ